jgi:hypothetical protein
MEINPILTELDTAVSSRRWRRKTDIRVILAVPLFQFFNNIISVEIIPTYYAIVQWENNNLGFWEIAPSYIFLVTRIYCACKCVGIENTNVFPLLTKPKVISCFFFCCFIMFC